MQSSTVAEDKVGDFSVPTARNAVVRNSASIILSACTEELRGNRIADFELPAYYM